MERLVAHHREIAQALQVTDRGMQVNGLNGIAREGMNDVKELSKLHEVAEIDLIAAPTTSITISTVGSARDGAKDHGVAAEFQTALGIARVQREGFGCLADVGLNQSRVEAHPVAA